VNSGKQDYLSSWGQEVRAMAARAHSKNWWWVKTQRTPQQIKIQHQNREGSDRLDAQLLEPGVMEEMPKSKSLVWPVAAAWWVSLELAKLAPLQNRAR
jgi:hypothetical protein